MKTLVALLQEHHYTIASIESLTAGLFTSKMAEIAGASQVLKGGLVSYQTSCKEEVLHLDKNLIARYGVISKEVADAMALQGRKMFHTDICISLTGNAGPDVMDEKEVGLVHMAVAYKEDLHSFKKVFSGERNEIREQAVVYLVEEVKELLKF